MTTTKHRWTVIRPSRTATGRVEMIIAPGDRGGALSRLTPHMCFSWAKMLITAAEKALREHPAEQTASISALKARDTRRRKRAGQRAAAARRRQGAS
jgi:hypothetical protein